MKIPTLEDVKAVFTRQAPATEAPKRQTPLSPKEVAIFGAKAIAREKRQRVLLLRVTADDPDLRNDILAEAAYLDELVEDWQLGRESYIPAFHKKYFDAGVIWLTQSRGAA